MQSGKLRFAVVVLLVYSLTIDLATARRRTKKRPCCSVTYSEPCAPAAGISCEHAYVADEVVGDACGCDCQPKVVDLDGGCCSAETSFAETPIAFEDPVEPPSMLDKASPTEKVPASNRIPEVADSTSPDEAPPAAMLTNEALEPSAEDQLPVPTAPLAVPDSKDRQVEVPVETNTEDAVVGDRYSGFSEPLVPSTSSQPLPSVADSESSEDTSDLFTAPSSTQDAQSDDGAVPEPRATAPISPPTDEQVPAEPEDDFDDLFGPSPTTATPVEEGSVAEVPDSDWPSSQMQEVQTPVAAAPEPASPQPAAPQPAESQPAGSLPAEAQPIDPEPVDASEKSEEAKEYDPFDLSDNRRSLRTGPSANARELQSNASRTWKDVSERFQCEATLERLTKSGVVLRLSDGGQRTVPYSRLASSDLRFVRTQIAAMRTVQVQRAAADQLVQLP